MRKIIAILLTIVMVVGIAACGGSGDASSDPTSSAVDSSVSVSEETQSTESRQDSSENESSDTATSSSKTSSTVSNVISTVTSSNRVSSVASSSKPVSVTTSAEQSSTTSSGGGYFDKEKITVTGSPSDPKNWIYQLGNEGVMVREVEIDSGKGGEAVEIVQISDPHFNKLNAKDYEENNPAVMLTYANRNLNKDGASGPNMVRCMEYASHFDHTVVTGDAMDYITWGSLEMVQNIIWKADPNAWVTLGNHDVVRTIWGESGGAEDKSTVESRYQLLQENWKHDVYYTSKVLKNKVMVIQLDNGNYNFWDSQVPLLEKDIKTAREKGYTVLLFYHIPLRTGKDTDVRVQAIRANDNKVANFRGTEVKQDEAGQKIYKIITNNADVIKATFCGHLHSDFYTEIAAKTSTGQATVIPQYVLTGAFYDYGHVMKITVK